ncbi:MAG: AI-2E family transporter [Deltaproteobacteria bacterium]|nr:AI-2E family transporter [Deltaproteobacteria bacterium]
MFPPDPYEPRVVTWLRNPGVRATSILLLLWVFTAATLLVFHRVLLPFGLAVLIAFIIEPFVETLTNRPVAGRAVPRIVAVLLIYATLGLAAYLLGARAIPLIGAEIARLGSESAAIVTGIRAKSSALFDATTALSARFGLEISRDDVQSFLSDNVASALDEIRHDTSRIVGFGRDFVASTFKGVMGTFLVLMLTAFLSVDRVRIERYARSMVPADYVESYGAILKGISVSLAGVVRGQLLICLTNGTLTFIGLWTFDVRFPFLLGLVASVFSLVPIFGSIISTIPIVVFALTDSLAKGIFALLWIIVIHLVEANLLNPKIMGDAAKIHPVIVVFVLMVGEQTAGLIGALFAVPVASVILTVFKFLHGRALNAQELARSDQAPLDELESSDPVQAGPVSTLDPQAGDEPADEPAGDEQIDEEPAPEFSTAEEQPRT